MIGLAGRSVDIKAYECRRGGLEYFNEVILLIQELSGETGGKVGR